MSFFTKTRKGLDEIETRSGGLHPRVRRLLILIDGRRSNDELATLLNDARFDESLAALQEGGYIEREAPPEPPPTVVLAPPADVAVATADSAAQLELARNFMMNTLKTFNGPYSKLSLMQRIHACTSREELHALFGDWLDSIRETRSGRQRAEELSARLQAVI